MLATTDAPANVQQRIPDEHDTHGLAPSNVSKPEAHDHDPGTRPKNDDGVRYARERHVLLPIDSAFVRIWKHHQQPIQL